MTMTKTTSQPVAAKRPGRPRKTTAAAPAIVASPKTAAPMAPPAAAAVALAVTPAEPPPTKIATIVALLRRPDGATLAEMMEATGWQGHSIHGAMAGRIRKGLGLHITSDKPGNERVWRIAAPAKAAPAEVAAPAAAKLRRRGAVK